MKRRFALFILLLGCFSLVAQGIDKSEITKPLDIESSEFSIVREAFSDIPVIGTFRQTKTVTGAPRKLTSSGVIMIVPDKGIVWQTEKPYKSVMVVTKQALFQRIRDGQPVKMKAEGNPVYTSIANVFECVFVGKFDVVRDLFDAKFCIKDGEWFILLNSQDKTISSFIDYILISGHSNMESLLMVERTGDTILYEIENVERRLLTNEEIEIFYF